jgi:hypothetical protein
VGGHDALAGVPFNVTVASDAAKPLLRGLCDPRYCPGPYSDYNGVAVGLDGRAYASFVDWCPAPCLAWRDVRNHAPGQAFVAVLPPWGPR